MFSTVAEYLSSVQAVRRDLGYDALDFISVVKQFSFSVQRQAHQLWLWPRYSHANNAATSVTTLCSKKNMWPRFDDKLK